jgi:hypothetical protein
MPKRREKIVSKGFSDIILYDYESNEVIDPGYIESVEFTKDIESEKIVDAQGRVVDELVKSETTTLSSVLLQSSVDELDLLSKKRYVYFRAWGKVGKDFYQVLIQKQGIIRPLWKREWKSEVAKINLQITGIDDLTSLEQYKIIDIDERDFPPLFEKVIDFYDFRQYKVNLPVDGEYDLTRKIDFYGYRRFINQAIKRDGCGITTNENGWVINVDADITTSLDFILTSPLQLGDAILYVGNFRLAEDFFFSPKFSVNEDGYITKVLYYKKSGAWTDWEYYSGTDNQTSFGNDIGFNIHQDGGGISGWVKFIFIFRNLTDTDINKLKAWVDVQ